jgi:hypothetical protein
MPPLPNERRSDAGRPALLIDKLKQFIVAIMVPPMPRLECPTRPIPGRSNVEQPSFRAAAGRRQFLRPVKG